MSRWRALGRGHAGGRAPTLTTPQARGQRARRAHRRRPGRHHRRRQPRRRPEHGHRQPVSPRAGRRPSRPSCSPRDNPGAILADEPADSRAARRHPHAPGCSVSALLERRRMSAAASRGGSGRARQAGAGVEGAERAGRGIAGRRYADVLRSGRHALLLRQRRQRGRRPAPRHRVRGALFSGAAAPLPPSRSPPTPRSSPPPATISASSRSSRGRSRRCAGRAICWSCTAPAAAAPICSPPRRRPGRGRCPPSRSWAGRRPARGRGRRGPGRAVRRSPARSR